MKHSIKKSLIILLISIQSIGYTQSAHRPPLNGTLSPSQKLIQAAASGRLTRVHELLRVPTINLDATNSIGSTALLTAGKVHKGGATMDWMEQEKERGITIQSASSIIDIPK